MLLLCPYQIKIKHFFPKRSTEEHPVVCLFFKKNSCVFTFRWSFGYTLCKAFGKKKHCFSFNLDGVLKKTLPFPLIWTTLVRATATAHAHEKVQQWLEKNNNIHWNKRVELMAVRDDPRFH